jgi:predicted nucleotidyltransferase component of viral defense system
MDESRFWALIALGDWSQQDDEQKVEPIIAALASQPKAEIVSFDEMLAEKLHALDTRAHCRAVYRGAVIDETGASEEVHVSADAFLYARAVAVAKGREDYEAALRDPKRMPDYLDWLEELLYVAQNAYEQQSGQAYEHATKVSFESFTNDAGWGAR